MSRHKRSHSGLDRYDYHDFFKTYSRESNRNKPPSSRSGIRCRNQSRDLSDFKIRLSKSTARHKRGSRHISDCKSRPSKATTRSKKSTRDLDHKLRYSKDTAMSRSFTCTVCSSTFSDTRSLLRHEREHQEQKCLLKDRRKSMIGKKNNMCPACGKNFRESSILTVHLRKHFGDKPYSCSICGKRYISKSRLTAHKLMHSCEGQFKPRRKRKSSAHLTIKSVKSKRANTRPRKQPSMYVLNIPKRRQTGENPLECGTCSKTFSDPRNLTRHRKTHDDLLYPVIKTSRAKKNTSDAKRFVCKFCGRQFRRNGHLQQHTVYYHTPIKFSESEKSVKSVKSSKSVKSNKSMKGNCKSTASNVTKSSAKSLSASQSLSDTKSGSSKSDSQ